MIDARGGVIQAGEKVYVIQGVSAEGTGWSQGRGKGIQGGGERMGREGDPDRRGLLG